MSYMWVRVVVGLTSGTLVCLKAIPHVFPHQYFKRTMELKFDGREMEVPLRCKEQLARIVPKLGLNDKQDKISFFVCRSLFPGSAGATWLPNGAVIGVPLSFYFKHEEDFRRFREISSKDGKVPLQLQGTFARKLVDTQLSSDDSIAFLIGHELTHLCSTADFASNVLLAPSWLIATYEVARRTRKIVPRAPVILNGILKVGLYLLSFACYWRVQRHLNHSKEFKADEMSARCDLDVAKGGVDWLLKTMRFVSLMRSVQERDKLKEVHPKSIDFTHPKLLDRLRRLEVIVDEKIKGKQVHSDSEPAIQ